MDDCGDENVCLACVCVCVQMDSGRRFFNYNFFFSWKKNCHHKSFHFFFYFMIHCNWFFFVFCVQYNRKRRRRKKWKFNLNFFVAFFCNFAAFFNFVFFIVTNWLLQKKKFCQPSVLQEFFFFFFCWDTKITFLVKRKKFFWRILNKSTSKKKFNYNYHLNDLLLPYTIDELFSRNFHLMMIMNNKQ